MEALTDEHYVLNDEGFPALEDSLDSYSWHNSDTPSDNGEEMDDLDAVFSFYSNPTSPMLSTRDNSESVVPCEQPAAASPRSAGAGDRSRRSRCAPTSGG